jgi:hypothetical protein
MLRMESEHGWWMITHPDHARLAGAFAEAWGNAQYRKPEPHARVLHGITSYDDGWMMRDAHPKVTPHGKPSAFSIELVGKYAAFEEIDIEEYLAVREQTVRIIADKDPYAELLISLHTVNLLAEHVDRSTIAPDGLALVDIFLDKQRAYQKKLMAVIVADETLSANEKSWQTIVEHFRLLQACDNLSLLSCVAYASPSHLLHPLPLNNGKSSTVKVLPIGPRQFRLHPWPFAEEKMKFTFPARHLKRKLFASAKDLETVFHASPLEELTVELSQ